MYWENLKKNLCPFCENRLNRSDDGSMYSCSACIFTIQKSRFESIVVHRAFPDKEVRHKFHWENLVESRCIICNEPLVDKKNRDGTVGCSGDCPFIISRAKMQSFLDDPDHPCNVFYNRINAK